MESLAPLDPLTQFPELYERHFGAVYRTILAMVLSPAAAEDLAQESFVRAYRARAGFRPTVGAGAWLHRIAINTTISHLRRQKLARLLPGRLFMGTHAREYDQAEARTVVEVALRSLTPKLRAAVVLHFYEGLTRAEVAQALGIPPGTVASRIAKAMILMRQSLDLGDQFSPGERSENQSALQEA